MGIFDEKRKALDDKEPWTDDEKAAYQERDRDFIRNIQIKDNLTKAQAKKVFSTYINSTKKSKKKLALRNDIRRMLQSASPPTHSKPIEVDKHQIKKAPSKKKKGASTVKEAIIKSKAKSLPAQIKTSKRLINAQKKYPDAKLPELRHGVNSKWSQEYRLRNGQGRYYEGRIVEK